MNTNNANGFHETKRQVRVRLGRRKVMLDRPAMVGQPLVVSYGMGTDSTAMLILLRDLGIRPDAILFADTGGEKPGTYAYLEHMQAWLARVGFPAIQVVRLNSKHKTLEENVVSNFTLPSLAYGGKGCSIKWKADPMDRWVRNWEPHALAASAGMPTIRVIGYDAGPADSKRSVKESSGAFAYWYPLRQYGMTREDCLALIAREGLDQPGKSACFFCPATKKEELVTLVHHHPELVARGLRMEARAMARGNATKKAKDGSRKRVSTVGLGRSWSWRGYLQKTMPDALEELAQHYDIGQDLMPLTSRQQTLWASPLQSALDRINKTWLSVAEWARVWTLPHRETCQRIADSVKAGRMLADFIEEAGCRIAVFRDPTESSPAAAGLAVA